MLFGTMHACLQRIWRAHQNKTDLSYKEKFIFLFLCLAEPVYRFVFFLLQSLKKRKKSVRFSSFKVISIGNIAIGGTGKSVVASFLIRALKNRSGALVMRGYKGSNESSSKSLLVSSTTCSTVAGDEACMAAQSLQVSVVVGADRAQSCALLERQNIEKNRRFDFVVLDDAYQNHRVAKDIEILLLDARAPFENGHTLPAGRLREKDITRADVILFTHADQIALKILKKQKRQIAYQIAHNNIFAGSHEILHIRKYGQEAACQTDFFYTRNIAALAGIASFDSFCQQLIANNIAIAKTFEYPDHYAYTSHDMRTIMQKCALFNIDTIITTRKDWVKLQTLITECNKQRVAMPEFFVADVAFAFLTQSDSKSFFSLLDKKLGWQ